MDKHPGSSCQMSLQFPLQNTQYVLFKFTQYRFCWDIVSFVVLAALLKQKKRRGFLSQYTSRQVSSRTTFFAPKRSSIAIGWQAILVPMPSKASRHSDLYQLKQGWSFYAKMFSKVKIKGVFIFVLQLPFRSVNILRHSVATWQQQCISTRS